MKKLSTIFAVLAILLSDVMCAVVAYNYCALEWGGKYEAWSAPASTALLLAIPYAIGIIICVVLAIIFKRKYMQIKKMRTRDPELSANWGTICTPVQMPAADGKMRKIQAANTEGLLRIIQSIPSPKAEPFKRWLAQVGRERIEETIDPEQAIDRALETYQKRDMIQTGFISGFFLSVSVMSLPLNGRSEAYSRAKNI